MSIGDVYKLNLEKIVSGGDTLGKYKGKPVFVAGGAPEEMVLCRIIEEHNTWARAELLEIINPSSVRVDSVCSFYGKESCGGCNLAHIDYNEQLKIKAVILKDSLLHALQSNVQIPEPEIFPSAPWGYRNRMQFHCLRQQAKGTDGLKIGLKGRRRNEIIAVPDCPVAVQGIRDALKGDGFPLPVEKDRFNVFSKDDVLLSEGGKQKGKIKLLDKEIFVDVSLFFQSNCSMLEKLILELRKIAHAVLATHAAKDLPMADLYCGVGTFAFFLSDLFPKLILAEESKASVSLARENLKLLNVNAELFALRDTEWYKSTGRDQKESFSINNILLHQKEKFGFIIADPPRAGLSSKLAQIISQEGPPVFAYVSCDAASLARDAKILVNGGYKLNKLLMFDFYPQTAHIESLAVFEK